MIKNLHGLKFCQDIFIVNWWQQRKIKFPTIISVKLMIKIGLLRHGQVFNQTLKYWSNRIIILLTHSKNTKRDNSNFEWNTQLYFQVTIFPNCEKSVYLTNAIDFNPIGKQLYTL